MKPEKWDRIGPSAWCLAIRMVVSRAFSEIEIVKSTPLDADAPPKLLHTKTLAITLQPLLTLTNQTNTACCTVVEPTGLIPDAPAKRRQTSDQLENPCIVCRQITRRIHERIIRRKNNNICNTNRPYCHNHRTQLHPHCIHNRPTVATLTTRTHCT
jgi:hypothetical protein